MTTEGSPRPTPDIYSDRVILTHHHERHTEGPLRASVVTGESYHAHFGDVETAVSDDDSLTAIVGNVGSGTVSDFADLLVHGNVDELVVTNKGKALVDGNIRKGKAGEGGEIRCTGSIELPNRDEHGVIIENYKMTEDDMKLFESKLPKKRQPVEPTS